jgi:pimeloyl-ACP methyl ester carboxylesterase
MRATSRPGTFTDADFQRYRHAWWQRGAFTSMINYYRAMLRRPVRLPSRLPFSAPVLILWGAQDFALVRQGAELSAAALPDARLVFFEGASHWVHLEEADWVNARLIDFLEGK